jgi:hypothetical protein
VEMFFAQKRSASLPKVKKRRLIGTVFSCYACFSTCVGLIIFFEN